MIIRIYGANKMSRVLKNLEARNSGPSVVRNLGTKGTAIMLAVFLGGCASYEKDHFTVGSVPQDYRTKHPIVVSQSEVSEDIIVTRDMKGMSFRQQNVVTSFLTRYRRSGAKTIRILLPAGSHNEAAARRVGNEIATFIKEERIDSSSVIVSRYHAANHGDAATIRISFDAVTAGVASKCGQWDEDLIETSQNQNYNNFGCATQNNLSQMIANPEDLIGPRGESEIDAARRDNVINDWRTNGTPSLPSLL